MPECVRCKDCAFLSVRNASTSDVYPADERVRKYGTPKTRLHYAPEGIGGGGFPMEETDSLICYYGIAAFSEDMKTLRVPEKAISKDRACSHFRRWISGKTPKEHEDMAIIEQVRAEQSAFREQEERRRVEWRREDRNDMRSTRIIAIFAAAGTILSAAVASAALWVSLNRVP
ncbi:MAG: hypothetical protein WD063_12945 [Pirellulales bacterium]